MRPENQTKTITAMNVDHFQNSFFTDCKGEYGKAPMRFRHFLGANKNGEDVLSGLLHGIKFSLFIGIFSYLISSLLGIVLGSTAGYFGDNQVESTIGSTFVFLVGLILAYFYGFIARANELRDAFSNSGFSVIFQFAITIGIIVGILFLFYYLGKWIGKLPLLNKKIFIPVDSILSLAAEIILPQVTTSGGTPTPRNERLDSVSIQLAIPKAIATKDGASAFGKACLKIMRASLNPNDLPACI